MGIAALSPPKATMREKIMKCLCRALPNAWQIGKEHTKKSSFSYITWLLTVFFLFICLFLYSATLGLSYGTQDLHCITWDLSLWHTDSLVAASGFSCWAAGSTLNQGLNLCWGLNLYLLHCRVDSKPLHHQGSPDFLKFSNLYFTNHCVSVFHMGKAVVNQ